MAPGEERSIGLPHTWGSQMSPCCGGRQHVIYIYKCYLWLVMLICTLTCAHALNDAQMASGELGVVSSPNKELATLNDTKLMAMYNSHHGFGDEIGVVHDHMKYQEPLKFTSMEGIIDGNMVWYDPEYGPDNVPSLLDVSRPVSANDETPVGKSSTTRRVKTTRTGRRRVPRSGFTLNPNADLISSPKNPFKPRKKFNFRNVSMEVADSHLDLRDTNGIIIGRFTLSAEDSYTLALLSTLKQRNYTMCNVKWVPDSKDKKSSEGHIHFECNSKVPARGYTGEIPVAIEIVGLTKKKLQKVYLSTDGYGFHRQFENLDSIKHAILIALGIDTIHNLKIKQVNRRTPKNDVDTYNLILEQVERGAKLIRLTVEPLIRLAVNLQEPYSPSSENFSHDMGNFSISDYTKLLKDRKKLSKVAKENLGEDADGFTLVGINDVYEGSKDFRVNKPSDMPIEMDEKWTFMPDVTVRFHYLDNYITSKSFPVHTTLVSVVDYGRDLIKKNRGGKSKKEYRVYAYSLPGCPLEEPDIHSMMERDKKMTINKLPFNDACINRRTHIINFYYLNTKPANYIFDVDLTNPDGSHTETKRVTVKYVEDTDLGALKNAIVEAFQRDGHLITPDDLTFVNVVTTDGHDVNDKTRILKLSEIPKEQMMGHPSHVTLKVSPHIMGYFTEPNGKHDTFEINLGSTRPSMGDIRHAFEDELHRRNLLKPDESLHTTLKFHPLDAKKRVKMNMFLQPDETGHFPAGSKLRNMAAEADSRYEIPIRFKGDDDKIREFVIKVPYGASNQQIEDLIANEIERLKYGSRPQEFMIHLKGHDDEDLSDIWNGDFDDNIELVVEPARLVDIDGIIDDIPTNFSLRIHPHEGREELEKAIRRSLMGNPAFERAFKVNPNHINDISTIIIGDDGNPYSDEDFDNHDIYNNYKKINIGISDHPLTLTWKNPENGKETPLCFNRASDGACRGVPMHILVKLTFHKLAEIMKSSLRNDKPELYKEMMSIPHKNKHLTSSLKLENIVLVNGKKIPTYGIQMEDSIMMLEHMYGINPSHLSSLTFTLLTHEEQQHLQDRLGRNHAIRIVLNKESGDPESHVVIGDNYGPAELRSVINKYFRGVDDASNIEGMTINGEEYQGQPLSYFINKMENKNSPLKVSFNVANDTGNVKGPSILNVKIQPKYQETLRSYFDRAMEEPRDFGLSPMHSYTISCINEKGERIHIDDILDQPISALGICKDIELQKTDQGRSYGPSRVYVMEEADQPERITSITLDERNDNTSNLNRQLRNFLMDIPMDDFGDVTVLIDDKPVKCSMSSLREAYLIKNLTLDTLLSLCNLDPRKTAPSVFKLSVNKDSPQAEGKKSVKKSGLNTEEGPACYFTLHKGQHEIGVNSIIPITLGTLKSPVKDFHTKLATMFGNSAMNIGNVRLSVVRNGELTLCNTMGKIKSLSDFKNLPLQNILIMCNIPVGVPEDSAFYHFKVSIPFGEDMTYSSNVRLGGNVPVEMLYKNDDEFATINYDEDLHLPIYDFMVDHPDIDMDHLNHYTLRIKGQNPGNDTVNHSFRLDHIPSEISLSSIFPHTPMSNIVFEIEDTTDPYNSSGDWRTGMSYPVNDYRNNFDAIKRQMLINLKGMHGNGLSKLNGYNVVVTINGEKHRCHIKSLMDLEAMTFEEFKKVCVNVDRISNNPSMKFNVGYESGRGLPEINFSCMSNDYETVKASHLSPKDTLPPTLIDILKKKYGEQNLKDVQWGVTINGMQGNCHFDDITTAISLSEILERCGVDDVHGRRFDIAFHDLSVGYKDADAERQRSNAGKNPATQEGNKNSQHGIDNDGFVPLISSRSHLLHPSADFADVHPNIFINMPQDYNGPTVNVNGNKSVNDYVRDIIMEEDAHASGIPINITINNNGHNYDFNTIPMDDLNYPSNYLNGNIAINVKNDVNGNLPGTIRTLHLPVSDKPLSTYFKILKNRVPNIGDKKILLVGNKVMLEEDRIPIELLLTPMKDLKKAGFVVSLVNDPEDYIPPGDVRVNILSRDGFNSNVTINDLQEPLISGFKKIVGDNVNLPSLVGSKFKVIVDGIEKVCQLPQLDRLFTSVSMQDILTNCGVNDFKHSHSFTLYFDSLIGGENGEHRKPFKLEVDLDDKVESTSNIDYSTDINVSDSALDFLKSKPNSHIFFEMEGKGFREFVEVDTEKFRKLLKAHPSVVDLLLRMGVPQEHLGGVDCLKIILSTLSQVLQGHQQYSVNNTEKGANFSLDDPLGKYQSIMDIAKTLKEYTDQDVTLTVQLSNGNTKYFTIPNQEFLHALNGGLTFKDVVLWGLSKEEADQIINIDFNTAPYNGVKEDMPESLEDKNRASPPSATSNVHQQKQENMSQEQQRGKSSNPTHVSEALQKSHNAGTITPNTILSEVPVIMKAMREHNSNLKFTVSKADGENLEIIVKGSMVNNTSQQGTRIVDLLSYFIPKEDIDNITSISVQLVADKKKFFVPLTNHQPFVMPIMASDEPKQCELQEFKNPWNPQKKIYHAMSLKSAIDAYRAHYKIHEDLTVKGAYLLRKENGNNISAEILFDENHKADKSVLNRKVGSDINNGKTLFLRFMSNGELAM